MVRACGTDLRREGTVPGNISDHLFTGAICDPGMFVTVLGRMENIDPTQAGASGFMDVPEDAYYAGYVG